MFLLHETTQRRVCRIAFVALCVVPTVLTLAAVAYCNRPWRQRDWQDSLASQLHVRAEITDVTRPRPGAMVLDELRLADLESDDHFCSIGRVHFQRADGRLVIDVDRLEIPADGIEDFWSSIATWLATGEQQAVELRVEQLTIANKSLPPCQFKDVTVRSEKADESQQRIAIVADDSSDAKLKIELSATGGVLNIAVDAREAPLPAWLVGQFAPGVQSCGAAEFTGVAALQQTNRVSNGRLQGEFSTVELQDWIGRDGPHRLQGLATLQFDELTWTDGRITLARGNFRTGSGTMSYSLFDNAQKLCGCQPGRAWDTPIPSSADTTVPFDQAAVRFELTAAGLAFAGQCPDGALMAKDQAPLVTLSQPEIIIPSGRLVRLLNYLDQPGLGWLPAIRSAHDMADSLPLPGDESAAPSGGR